MSSCVKPLVQSKEPPVVLLHGFDRCSKYARDKIFVYTFYAQVDPEFHAVLLFSSCLEWRYGYPLLEEAGFETWAVDILGWGFCDLGLFCYFSDCILFFYPFLREVFVMLSFLCLLYPSEKLQPCDVVSKRNHFYQVLIYSLMYLLYPRVLI